MTWQFHCYEYAPKEMKTGIRTSTHDNMIHNSQKLETSQVSPPVGPRINKGWSVHTVEYYPVIRKDEVLTRAAAQRG